MIRFDRVAKHFGAHEVLRDVSFEVPAGQIWFVLGTSGTGKSVLLKTIVGLLSVTAGRIFVDDEDVSNLPEDEWLRIRRKCGMVFQQPALFDSLTVFENVAFGLRQRNPDLDKAALQTRVTECLAWVHLK